MANATATETPAADRRPYQAVATLGNPARAVRVTVGSRVRSPGRPGPFRASPTRARTRRGRCLPPVACNATCRENRGAPSASCIRVCRSRTARRSFSMRSTSATTNRSSWSVSVFIVVTSLAVSWRPGSSAWTPVAARAAPNTRLKLIKPDEKRQVFPPFDDLAFQVCRVSRVIGGDFVEGNLSCPISRSRTPDPDL